MIARKEANEGLARVYHRWVPFNDDVIDDVKNVLNKNQKKGRNCNVWIKKRN